MNHARPQIRAARDWQPEGHCYQTYATIFFPTEGDFDDEAAIKVCNGEESGTVCPVKEECYKWAKKTKQTYGVWGGVRIG